MASLFTFSLGAQFPMISMPMPLSPLNGGRQWLSGLLQHAILSSSSPLIPLSLTRHSGMFIKPWFSSNNHWYVFESGDWASGVWGSSGIPGQEQSCAQRTGVATCEDFVRNNGGALSEACASPIHFSHDRFLWRSWYRLGSQERKDLPDLVDWTRLLNTAWLTMVHRQIIRRLMFEISEYITYILYYIYWVL